MSIINNLEEGYSVKVFYTEDSDNHTKVKEMISKGDNKEYMKSYFSEFEEYGVITYCHPDGVWTNYIDFEVVL